MINSQSDQLSQARSLVEQAKEVVIALPTNPTYDSVAGALSLYLGLSSRGVGVTVICPDQMIVEFNHLIGVDKVINTLSSGQGKNLVISFPYQEGSIEKVSYNIENDTFNLVIEPREGYPLITAEAIKFSNSGGNTDLIITVGVAELSSLNNLYNNNQGLFSEKAVLNIDTNIQNSRYGRVNVVDPNISSVSELTISLLSNFGITMNADIASNLLAGLTSGSQNFASPQTQASTYEAAAMCIRSGARKIVQNTVKTQPSVVSSQQVTPTFNKPIMSVKAQQPNPRQQTQFSPQIRPQQQSQPQYQQAPQQPQKKQTNETPPDWLKPKIYKGSTLL